MTGTQTTTRMSYADAQQYREGMKEFAGIIKPSLLMTFSYNRPKATSFTYGEERLRKFHGRLDFKLLGSRWARYPSVKRTHSIAMVHGTNGSGLADRDAVKWDDFHQHVMAAPTLYSKLKLDLAGMDKLCRELWKELVPSGDIWMEETRTVDAAMNYASRMMAAPDCPGILYFSVN